jgi:hypothetical protein
MDDVFAYGLQAFRIEHPGAFSIGLTVLRDLLGFKYIAVAGIKLLHSSRSLGATSMGQQEHRKIFWVSSKMHTVRSLDC